MPVKQVAAAVTAGGGAGRLIANATIKKRFLNKKCHVRAVAVAGNETTGICIFAIWTLFPLGKIKWNWGWGGGLQFYF